MVFFVTRKIHYGNTQIYNSLISIGFRHCNSLPTEAITLNRVANTLRLNFQLVTRNMQLVLSSEFKVFILFLHLKIQPECIRNTSVIYLSIQRFCWSSNSSKQLLFKLSCIIHTLPQERMVVSQQIKMTDFCPKVLKIKIYGSDQAIRCPKIQDKLPLHMAHQFYGTCFLDTWEFLSMNCTQGLATNLLLFQWKIQKFVLSCFKTEDVC